MKGYSHGMKQRLGIAAALLRAPRLLLLDEPTTGLDPAGMRDMRQLVRRLADEGMTVLLSSHLMGEVEELCDRVAIVRSGRVIYEGALDALLHSTGRATGCARPTTSARSASASHSRASARWRAAGAASRSRSTGAGGRGLSVALVEAGVAITALVPAAASLEELFFRLTEGDGPPSGNGGAPIAEAVGERRRRARGAARASAAAPASARSTAGSCASCARRSGRSSASAWR